MDGSAVADEDLTETSEPEFFIAWHPVERRKSAERKESQIGFDMKISFQIVCILNYILKAETKIGKKLAYPNQKSNLCLAKYI